MTTPDKIAVLKNAMQRFTCYCHLYDVSSPDKSKFDDWIESAEGKSHLQKIFGEYGELKQSPRWVSVEHLPLSVPANQRLFVRVVKNGYYDCLSAAVLRTPAYQKYGYEYLDMDESESPKEEAVEFAGLKFPVFSFAEWASHSDWTFVPSKRLWYNEEEEERITPKTSTELYTLFKQTK